MNLCFAQRSKGAKFEILNRLCYNHKGYLVKQKLHSLFWRGVRVVDGDALEMRFGETQRGFKSPPLR